MAATEILKPGDVPSPCINFCRLDRSGVLCLGCFRSLDEIVNWSSYTPAQKQAVLDALPARMPSASAK
jgi:predicted Fe-S protein YdhL (DUF1289 family)